MFTYFCPSPRSILPCVSQVEYNDYETKPTDLLEPLCFVTRYALQRPSPLYTLRCLQVVCNFRIKRHTPKTLNEGEDFQYILLHLVAPCDFFPLMSFGFSIGDSIAVGKLIVDSTSSLRTTGGAKVEFQDLIRSLEDLLNALCRLDRLT